MRAPKPSLGPHFARYKRSSTGMRNASVLPEPVLAAPRTSRPFRDIGIDLAWISVSWVYAARFRPVHRAGQDNVRGQMGVALSKIAIC